MRQFTLWLRQKHDPMDAPLVAAITHLRFVEIHPFWDGNGRTARALCSLILQRYGYRFNRLVSPDRQFAWELRKYFEEIGRTVGSEFQENRDLTPWTHYFLLSLTVEISTVSNQLVDFRRFMAQMQEQFKPLGLTKRQIDLLAYARIHGTLRARDYLSGFCGSRETARRAFNSLVQHGLLQPVGSARMRRYQLIAGDGASQQ